jgi:hypothetical protein
MRPRAAMSWGRRPSIRFPRKWISPLSGLRRPVMRLKRVVLPLPLGPMSPEILRPSRLIEQSETARVPPKAFVTFRISITALPLFPG